MLTYTSHSNSGKILTRVGRYTAAPRPYVENKYKGTHKCLTYALHSGRGNILRCELCLAGKRDGYTSSSKTHKNNYTNILLQYTGAGAKF